jgi:hypothetical protein
MRTWLGESSVGVVGDNVDVSIGVDRWTALDAEPSLPRPVDAAVVGRTEGVRLPSSGDLRALDRGLQFSVCEDRQLPGGTYAIDCPLEVETVVRFEGPATVSPVGEGMAVTFPKPTEVTVGFRETQREELTVEPTPEGVARALSYASAAATTTGPARSHPCLRSQPPLFSLGETTTVDPPADGETAALELVVPPDLGTLFVLAPLSYYLAASLTVEADATPTLRTDAGECLHRFAADDSFQEAVAAVLRQVFYLDCLVRDVGSEAATVETALLEDLDLDPESLREATQADRLARYLDLPASPVVEALPDWPLATYVAPVERNVTALPWLLDTMSLVYLPSATAADGTELLEEALGDAYRDGEEVHSVDVLRPEFGDARAHAWLAPGTPVQAVKLTSAGIRNRLRTDGSRSGPFQVAVVLNDEEMTDEHQAVVDIYRDRAASAPLELSVHEYLTTDRLAEVFAAPNDFVHFIGHCDTGGLQCPDGGLRAASLDECRTRTFFLNACGSYYEGHQLVEQGAVAGAVTLQEVTDNQAVTVGTAFARLLAHGFGIERAMQLSRRRVMMSTDYAVVGDGTYTLAPDPDEPLVLRVEDHEEGYRVAADALAAGSAGGRYHCPFTGDVYQQGTGSAAVVDDAALGQFLRSTDCPVVRDGELSWSSELASSLGLSPAE